MNVREMGAHKAMVTFDLKESKEEALSTAKDLLLKYFEDVRAWNDVEWCLTRWVWLEYYRIPPHAWTSKNTKKIKEE